jgi:hypothetical protein
MSGRKRTEARSAVRYRLNKAKSVTRRTEQPGVARWTVCLANLGFITPEGRNEDPGSTVIGCGAMTNIEGAKTKEVTHESRHSL